MVCPFGAADRRSLSVETGDGDDKVRLRPNTGYHLGRAA